MIIRSQGQNQQKKKHLTTNHEKTKTNIQLLKCGLLKHSGYSVYSDNNNKKIIPSLGRF